MSRRRKFAWSLLVGSLVLGHVNMAGVLAGWISHEQMDLITNYLSWLAVTLTAMDLLMTSGVRDEQEAG